MGRLVDTHNGISPLTLTQHTSHGSSLTRHAPPHTPRLPSSNQACVCVSEQPIQIAHLVPPPPHLTLPHDNVSHTSLHRDSGHVHTCSDWIYTLDYLSQIIHTHFLHGYTHIIQVQCIFCPFVAAITAVRLRFATCGGVVSSGVISLTPSRTYAHLAHFQLPTCTYTGTHRHTS